MLKTLGNAFIYFVVSQITIFRHINTDYFSDNILIGQFTPKYNWKSYCTLNFYFAFVDTIKLVRATKNHR